MAKTKISEFSSTPGNNTDIDSINIAEGCAPSGINNAIRELMAQLKDWQSGTSNDPYVVGSSGSLTLSYGTANGVAYLNGSKVLTTGSALTFDGAALRNTSGQFEGIDNMTFSALVSTTNATAVTLNSAGTSGTIRFQISGSEQMRLTSTGLGIGTSSPFVKLSVATAASTFAASFQGSSSTNLVAIGTTSFGASINGYTAGFATTADLVLQPNGGNLGLGVTPSAWESSRVAFQNGAASFASSPSNRSVAEFSANSYISSGGTFRYIYNANASLYQQVTGEHRWYTAPSGTAGNAISFTQAMTLDASGNLGIGTSSPSAKLHVSGTGTVRQKLASTSGAVELQLIANSQSNASYSNIYSGDGTNWNWAIGGSNGTSNTMTFLTGGAERMRIDSSGNLLVGTTTTGLGNAAGFGFNASQYLSIGHANGTGNGTEYISFGYNGSKIGSITQSGTTAVLYNTTSDQRLKENIQDADSASSLIDSLQVRKFDWKSDSSHQRYGFVAQELVTVAPEAVHQPANPDDMMAVDYSKLVPMLVKEIQSLRQRLAALESN